MPQRNSSEYLFVVGYDGPPDTQFDGFPNLPTCFFTPTQLTKKCVLDGVHSLSVSSSHQGVRDHS